MVTGDNLRQARIQIPGLCAANDKQCITNRTVVKKC